MYLSISKYYKLQYIIRITMKIDKDNKIFFIMPAAIFLAIVLALSTFTVSIFAQSAEGDGANQTVQDAGQSANQTGESMQQGASETASSAGQSANQTGEAIQGNASEVGADAGEGAKELGSNITEGAKGLAETLGKGLQDLAK